jgi:predicted DsbA family dithiol-disulfide isomerase
MQRRLVSGWLAGLTAFGLGCGTLGIGKKSEPVAARVGDEVITVAELDEAIKMKLYDVRSEELKRIVADRALEVEAKKRNLTVDAMLDEEFKKLPPVTEADIKAFYDKNAAQMQNTPLEAISPRIRSHLESEAKHGAYEAIIARANTKIELERPRVALRPGGPSRGPADAKVTIVEFSDFQCPFCQRAKPVLDEIVTRHPNDVRIVYRNLPLDSLHPRARASAEAAACAADGNKFWEYHDKLFANNRALGDPELRKYAEEVGLDKAAFEECVTSRKHASAVEADVEEAKKIGITGTPAFVVNGILMTGLQTADALDELIQEELGQPAKSGS